MASQKDEMHTSRDGSWRGRMPLIGPTLVVLHRSENRVPELMVGLACIGFALLLLAAVVPATRGETWLPAVGGAFLGVGLSVVCTIAASRQSAIEGYTKEANLRRKTDYYGPLYSELKRLHDNFAAAQVGTIPYPQWIDIPDEPSRQFDPNYSPPALVKWGEFRSDHRMDEFTPEARVMFDKTVDAARAYNAATDHMRNLACSHVIAVTRHSIAAIIRQPQYKAWEGRQQASHSPHPVNLNAAREPATPEEQEYTIVAEALSFGSTVDALAESWGNGWIRSWTAFEPLTLGRMLGNHPDEAGRQIYETLKRQNPSHVMRQEWYEEVIKVACAHLLSDPIYRDWRSCERALVAATQAPLNKLAHALTYIRDRYEGGIPLV